MSWYVNDLFMSSITAFTFIGICLNCDELTSILSLILLLWTNSQEICQLHQSFWNSLELQSYLQGLIAFQNFWLNRYALQVLAACSLIKNLNPKYYLFSQPSSSNPTPYLDFKPILNNTPSQHNSQASTNPEIIWLTVTKFKVKYSKSLWTLCKRSRNYNRIK